MECYQIGWHFARSRIIIPFVPLKSGEEQKDRNCRVRLLSEILFSSESNSIRTSHEHDQLYSQLLTITIPLRIFINLKSSAIHKQ